jgi:hypothetical protein
MKHSKNIHHNHETLPCRKRGCPRDCPERVVICEVPWPPFKLALHEREFKSWLASQPDRTHPSA